MTKKRVDFEEGVIFQNFNKLLLLVFFLLWLDNFDKLLKYDNFFRTCAAFIYTYQTLPRFSVNSIFLWICKFKFLSGFQTSQYSHKKRWYHFLFNNSQICLILVCFVLTNLHINSKIRHIKLRKLLCKAKKSFITL